MVPSALLALILGPFVVWGEGFTQLLSWEGTRSLLEQQRAWGWCVGIGLLVADLFLPIPGTIVMSVLGWMYGPFLGGLAAAMGSFLSAYCAYGLSRGIGRRMALRLAGRESLESASVWFSRAGGLTIAFSRCLPVLNEAVACLAGLSLFPHRQFVFAALAGSIPVGFAFAWVGHLGHKDSNSALLLSVAVPVILWGLYRRAVR
jgi:uncharacterized membrane protein YdjX (TVP38/TMEM64 family)